MAKKTVFPRSRVLQKKRNVDELSDVQPIPMATIDVGAHSARLLIAEVNRRDGSFNPLEELEKPVPLGSNVFRNAQISDESIQILSEVLYNFRLKMDEYGVVHYKAIATSAVREAENVDIFIERIRHATGLDIQIFAGTDEARLDYIAVNETVPQHYGFHSASALIADIGTGACQVSAYNCGELSFTETLKVGTLRALEQMHGTYSSSAINYYTSIMIDNAFSELRSISANLKAEMIIAMGTSARTLLTLLKGRRSSAAVACVTKEEFFLLHSKVSDLTYEQISEKYALPPDLAEMVQPCCLILDNLLRLTDAEKILIPMISTKYLLLRDFINVSFGIPDSFEQQLHGLIMSTAARYRCANEYCERTTAFAAELFRKLEKLHGLGHSELLILTIAARLHKCGLFINNQAYHKHSSYIIQNTEIPGISAEQRKIAALVVRYHRKSPPKMLHPEYAGLSREDRSLVNKLAAILRIACALAPMALPPEELTVKLEPAKVLIRLGDTVSYFPESMSEVDTDYFRSVYARKIIFS